MEAIQSPSILEDSNNKKELGHHVPGEVHQKTLPHQYQNARSQGSQKNKDMERKEVSIINRVVGKLGQLEPKILCLVA